MPGQESKEAQCDATLDLEMVRVKGKSDDANPWRVSKIKANVVRQVKYTEFWVDLPQ